MKVFWICGLPEEVRVNALDGHLLSPCPCSAWGWVLGHLPPPRDIELHIVCTARNLWANRIDFTYKGAHWHCIREIRGEQYIFRVPSILKVRRIVREIAPDIVEGWGGETGFGWIATWCTKRPLVRVQGLLRLYDKMLGGGNWLGGKRVDRLIRRTIELLSYGLAHRLITESKLSHDALLEFYGHNSIIIYHPLREQFISGGAKGEREATFMYLGSFEKRKGVMDVVMALDRMKNKNTRLVMVGSGAQQDEVGKYVIEHGLANRVEFMHNLDAREIVEAMGKCLFYVLPSYGDTGPTSLKEALAQGLYPICYDNTGPKEHIERYGFGKLCPTGHVDALSIAMDEAYENASAISGKSAEVADRVRYDLSAENIWPKMLKVYRDIGEIVE